MFRFEPFFQNFVCVWVFEGEGGGGERERHATPPPPPRPSMEAHLLCHGFATSMVETFLNNSKHLSPSLFRLFKSSLVAFLCACVCVCLFCVVFCFVLIVKTTNVAIDLNDETKNEFFFVLCSWYKFN